MSILPGWYSPSTFPAGLRIPPAPLPRFPLIPGAATELSLRLLVVEVFWAALLLPRGVVLSTTSTSSVAAVLVAVLLPTQVMRVSFASLACPVSVPKALSPLLLLCHLAWIRVVSTKVTLGSWCLSPGVWDSVFVMSNGTSFVPPCWTLLWIVSEFGTSSPHVLLLRGSASSTSSLDFLVRLSRSLSWLGSRERCLFLL